MTSNDEIVQRTAEHVRSLLSGEGSGHDWWHIHRVWNSARAIGRDEQVKMAVVELASLLHDIADWKFHHGDETEGPRKAREWMDSLSVDKNTIDHVCTIIEELSFKGAGTPTPMSTREGMVVQDADRLDAIGAIGIARAFAYGGYKKRTLFDPETLPAMHASFDEYKKSAGTTINHFHEKLLLLKDRMNTATAKRIADERHRFMEEYLRRFHEEWSGKS